MLKLNNQAEALKLLENLAKSRRNCILIEGQNGVGKSYLANVYKQMLGIEDIKYVKPKVSEIRETVESCVESQQPVLICIENLDTATKSSSNALLKFLEEPNPNVFIAVTCRNLQFVVDTIISRCAVVSVSPLLPQDIEAYASSKYADRVSEIKPTSLWNCIVSISDVDLVFGMTNEQLKFYKTIETILNGKDSVSGVTWKLQKYQDGTATPIEIVIRYIMQLFKSNREVWYACHSCLVDLSIGRLSSNAVLTKFVFEFRNCAR